MIASSVNVLSLHLSDNRPVYCRQTGTRAERVRQDAGQHSACDDQASRQLHLQQRQDDLHRPLPLPQSHQNRIRT